MNALRALFSYPLLARELTERAARKRTYAVRVGYGLVLYTIFILAVQRLVAQAAGDPTGLGGLGGLGGFGFGRELLHTLVDLQCWGVLLMQPALMAGGITYEKERDSLSLLILTGMRPWKIVMEKYLAGLLPMATLLLLALPLGAITMGYGGVSPQLVVSGAGVIVAAWLMAGSIALLCSAWCRTTVQALIASYAVGALLLLGPALVYSLTVRYVLWGANLSGVAFPDWLWALWPPEIFARVLAWQQAAAGGLGWSATLLETLGACAGMLGVAAIGLLLAVLALGRRGLLQPVSRVGSPWSDRFPRAAALGQRFLRWWETVWPPPPALPTDDPVAWRESGRGGLSRRLQFLYLTFALTALTLIVSVILLRLYPRTGGPERLHYFGVLLGAMLALILIVCSANSLLDEHTNQTFAILLTTPLGIREILLEKVRALGRYRVLIFLVLGTVFILQGWSEYEYVRGDSQWQLLGQYWICACMALAVYSSLIIWVTFFITFALRTRAKAILVSLAVFAVWFLAPIYLLNFSKPDWRDHRSCLWLSLASPLGILDANEHDRLGAFSAQEYRYQKVRTRYEQPWVPFASNFAFYAGLTLGFRLLTLRLADRWLRR